MLRMQPRIQGKMLPLPRAQSRDPEDGREVGGVEWGEVPGACVIRHSVGREGWEPGFSPNSGRGGVLMGWEWLGVRTPGFFPSGFYRVRAP